jgi:hypothetical protein
MQENDTERFYEVMALVCSAYEKEMSKEREALYFKMLSDYSIEDVERAAKRIMQTSKFFPQIADFVEALQGTDDEKAAGAWYVLISALNEMGADHTVNMGDPVLHQTAIDLDLWGIGIEEKGYPDQRLTGATVPQTRPDGVYYVPEKKDQTSFLRAEFIKRYKYNSKHSDYRSLPTKLTGLLVVAQRRNLELYGHEWPAEKILEAQNSIERALAAPVTLEAYRQERKQLGTEARKQLPKPEQKALPGKTDVPSPEEVTGFLASMREFGKPMTPEQKNQAKIREYYEKKVKPSLVARNAKFID